MFKECCSIAMLLSFLAYGVVKFSFWPEIASKETNAVEEQRPVAKPKESKKKDKKNKKIKKEDNGVLTEIKEENDEPEEADKTDESLPPEEQVEKTQEPITPVGESPPNSVVTLKEQASEHDLTEHDEVEDDDDISDIVEDDNVEEEKKGRTATPDIEKSTERSRKGTNDSNDTIDTRSANTLDDEEKKKFHNIHEVEAIKPEVLGIGYADEIFSNCAQAFEPFVAKNEEFRAAVLEFENSVEREKKQPDFERCWQIYNELLEKENERIVLPGSEGNLKRTISKSEVDICDLTVNLQAIRATGIELLRTIEFVRPRVDKCCTEAGTVDVIEYVKGKMVEGEQLGITSKFSAPGKYRRNMKQVKKAVKQLSNVESETKEILESVDSQFDNELAEWPSKDIVDDESAIIPTEKVSGNEDEDIFDKLEEDTSPKIDGKEYTVPVTIPADDTSSEKKQRPNLLEQPVESEKRSDSPTSIHQTYIIENIPEKNGVKNNSSHGISPLAKSVLDPRPKSPVTQVIVEEEEHNTLDFGKYIFIDPSTGDIQVMRNRSKSLDSLVSMASSRSSISRFGSFEFVTDFEINIAEKNQQQML